MRIKAHAKVNLFLQVKGKLDNGYHALEMVNTPIDLFDSIQINESNESSFVCDKYYIPTNKKNTMTQVLEKLNKIKKLPNLSINLVKNIPSLAGLAGGSSDAAALLNFLNEQYNYGLSHDELLDIASSVGADVPFCVLNQLAKVTGIGETITPLSRTLDFYLFIMKPSFGISTRELFSQTVLSSNPNVSIDKLIQALETNDYPLFLENMTNDLEKIAIAKHPILQELLDELVDFGFDKAMMSGSGSVIYGVSQDSDLVDEAVKAFYKKVPFVKNSRMLG
jgi:4-diphosphocytidyl-2-C-methyl-D-erythritol kinase